MAARSPASILFDSSGNAVGVLLDGVVYRLQTIGKVLNASGTQINPATQETLTSIKDTDGIKKITDPVAVTDNGGSITVDGTVSVNQPVAVTDNSGSLTVDDGGSSLTIDGTVTANAGTGPWPVTDNSGSLTVDAISWPLPTGAATETTLSSINTKTPALGQTTMASSSPVVLASNQSAIPVTDNAGSLTVDGTVTANAGVGPWPVTDNGGSLTVDATSLPLPTGASTAANQTTEITSLQLIDDLPNLNATSITGAKGVGVLGSDGSVLRWLKVDSNGSLVTAASPTANTYFRFGDVTTAVIAQAVVRRTTYTEQTSNAQRSIASSSASDTAAGTGARTVLITYYTVTGTGPFTETITLNGTAFVNTVATDICYVEEMEVASVGSGLSNVGILTLKATTAGGGATIGTIAAGDNQTFWAHHYIPTGLKFKLTGISCGHNGTTVGSGGLFMLKSKPINAANQVEAQLTDFVRLYGQSSTFARTYNSPITVVGPARVVMYVTPETSSSTIYRGAFDFFEE